MYRYLSTEDKYWDKGAKTKILQSKGKHDLLAWENRFTDKVITCT